jgi:predicted HicB family RNase H-like nuclease
MHDGPQRIAKTIRMREEVYHQARVAAVTSKKSLGQWIEEAVFEKLNREQPSNSRRA